MQIETIVEELQAERGRIEAAIHALEGISNDGRGRRRGRPPGRKRRKMSAEARAKISAAQRARWAKQKKAAKA
jgi:hypothetical protein